MDKDDRASLIALFNQLEVQILPTIKEIPSNAIATKEWCAFTSWETEPEDIGKEFHQVIQLLYPNGEQFGEPMTGSFFPQSGKAYSQVLIGGIAFPIGQEGPYTIRMRLEHGGSTVFESRPIIIRVTHHKLDSMPPNFIPIRNPSS